MFREFSSEEKPRLLALVARSPEQAVFFSPTLRARESTITVRLEEAVTAYLAALLEKTRERAPLQWAMTSKSLGDVLQALGTREFDTARLQEAIAAYRAALEEYTHERAPLQWATTSKNLGHAMQALGTQDWETARLEDAVDAYSAALEEYRADSPQREIAQAKLARATLRLERRQHTVRRKMGSQIPSPSQFSLRAALSKRPTRVEDIEIADALSARQLTIIDITEILGDVLDDGELPTTPLRRKTVGLTTSVDVLTQEWLDRSKLHSREPGAEAAPTLPPVPAMSLKEMADLLGQVLARELPTARLPRTPAALDRQLRALAKTYRDATEPLIAPLNNFFAKFEDHAFRSLDANKELAKSLTAFAQIHGFEFRCISCDAPSTLIVVKQADYDYGAFVFRHLLPSGNYTQHGGLSSVPPLRLIPSKFP